MMYGVVRSQAAWGI